MEKCSLPEQHAYFKACLEAGLIVRMDALIHDDSPIFTQMVASEDDPTELVEDEDAPVSLMAILNQIFLENYPLYNRRHDYHCASQPQGMTASDWISELSKMRDECVLEQMTMDDRFVQRILTSLSDAKLKKELMDIDDPTLDNIVRGVAKWESTKKSLKNPGNSFMKGVKPSPTATQAQVNQSTSKSTQKPKSKQSNASSNTKNKPSTSTPAKGNQPYQCYRCGNRDPAHNCRAKTATCKNCNKQGHYAGMCGSKLRAKVFNVTNNVQVSPTQPSASSA